MGNRILVAILAFMLLDGCAGPEKQVTKEDSRSATTEADKTVKKPDGKKYPIVSGEFLYILK